jgi:hypothetical protein
MKRLIFCITVIFIVFEFYSCQKDSTFIFPKAEITNIYNITLSTAQVDFQVTSQSNAHTDRSFSIIVDTITFNGNKIEVTNVNLNMDGYGKFAGTYSTKLSNLKSKTQYYISLYYDGVFDYGETYEDEGGFIGSPKTFTTN